MLNTVTAVSIILLSLISCTYAVRQKVLKRSNNDKDEIIKYEGSEQYGNYIDAVKKIKGAKVFYNFKINDKGNLMHP